MTNPPCRHCADRVMGCHGLCKAYNDWAVQQRENRQGNSSLIPPALKPTSFIGTSPKPGRHKYDRLSRH